VRVAGFIVGLLVAAGLLALWMLKSVVRGGTCGPAEGGGSCQAAVLSWVLLAGGATAAVAAVLALVIPRRRR